MELLPVFGPEMKNTNQKPLAGYFEIQTTSNIHWGTFDGMSDEPLDQAPKDLEIAKKESSVPLNFFVLKHGESWFLEKINSRLAK